MSVIEMQRLNTKEGARQVFTKGLTNDKRIDFVEGMKREIFP